jgi:ribonuclease D
MTDYPLLGTVDAVEELARKLSREKVVAVDTEADSFFHYQDKLCLLQLSARSGTWLVDPLALPEHGLKPLEPVFADPEIRKVFHAAEYDLYVLHRHAGIRVCNLFDTMVSAQLLGYPAVGLAALVERHFKVKLSKDQQRTDWSRRPLRDVQIQYAAADVLYLADLAREVERELRAAGRLRWAQEEFLALESRVWPEREFDETGYLRIKGAKRLAPRELAVLRELYLMRDRRARALDRPPFKVMGNGTLLELAQNPARSLRSLAKRKGITELVLRRMGQDIADAIRIGQEGPEHPPLESRSRAAGRRRLDRRGDLRLEHLKRWRKARAEQLGLDPGVFCPNSVLEEIAWANPRDTEEFARLDAVKRWWVEEFGAESLQVSAAANAQVLPDAPPSERRSRPRGRSRRRRGWSRAVGSAGGSHQGDP